MGSTRSRKALERERPRTRTLAYCTPEDDEPGSGGQRACYGWGLGWLAAATGFGLWTVAAAFAGDRRANPRRRPKASEAELTGDPIEAVAWAVANRHVRRGPRTMEADFAGNPDLADLVLGALGYKPRHSVRRRARPRVSVPHAYCTPHDDGSAAVRRDVFGFGRYYLESVSGLSAWTVAQAFAGEPRDPRRAPAAGECELTGDPAEAVAWLVAQRMSDPGEDGKRRRIGDPDLADALLGALGYEPRHRARVDAAVAARASARRRYAAIERGEE